MLLVLLTGACGRWVWVLCNLLVAGPGFALPIACCSGPSLSHPPTLALECCFVGVVVVVVVAVVFGVGGLPVVVVRFELTNRSSTIHNGARLLCGVLRVLVPIVGPYPCCCLGCNPSVCGSVLSRCGPGLRCPAASD